MVHGIATGMKGAVTVENPPRGGALFSVYMPLAGDRADASEADPGVDHLKGGSEHILLVDDELMLVDVENRLLSALGYRTTCFTDPLEALAHFKKNPDDFDLVLTDQSMPKLSGVDLAREILALRPDIPVVLCSGFSESITAEEALKMGVSRYLNKPVVGGELNLAIRDLLDQAKGKSGPE